MHLSLTEKYQQVLGNDQEPVKRNFTDGVKWVINDFILHRLDGPAVIRHDGTKEWWIYGERHRTDGPAVEWPTGFKMWFEYDKHHRLDGPATIYSDGRKEWWIDGVEYSESEFNKYVSRLKEIEKGSEEAGANLDF